MYKNIVLVGNGRCYHTMDWYRSIQEIVGQNKILFATDLKNSEGHRYIIKDTDVVVDLFNIDLYLFKNQSRLGDVWRNFVKLFFFPMQVLFLKKLYNSRRSDVFHAHTMYYMFVCWIAGIDYYGTPQGSEVLVRPGRSFLYKYFACKSLSSAKMVTVDSVAMRDKILSMCVANVKIVQNGVNAVNIYNERCKGERSLLVSIRGMTPLYRLDKILTARNNFDKNFAINFIYPFWDDLYKKRISGLFSPIDADLGRLDKCEMYKLLYKAKIVFSIPASDSSPRSVYEAIFAGACVVATYAPWYDNLTKCMKDRVLLVDLNDSAWFSSSIYRGNEIAKNIYVPSDDAFAKFDQCRAMKNFSDKYYVH